MISTQNASTLARVFGVPLVRIELTPPAPEAGALSAELQGHLRRSLPQPQGFCNEIVVPLYQFLTLLMVVTYQRRRLAEQEQTLPV